jgi:hypothetical protein
MYDLEVDSNGRPDLYVAGSWPLNNIQLAGVRKLGSFAATGESPGASSRSWFGCGRRPYQHDGDCGQMRKTKMAEACLDEAKATSSGTAGRPTD